MNELKLVIKKLQEKISEEYSGVPDVKKGILSFLTQAPGFLGVIDSIGAIEDSSGQVALFKSILPSLLKRCELALEADEGFIDEFMRLREIIVSTYIYVTGSDVKNELRVESLALEIESLESKKESLEHQILDLNNIIALTEQINQQSVDSASAVTDIEFYKSEIEKMKSEIEFHLSDIEQHKNAYTELASKIDGKLEGIEDTFGEIEDMKVQEVELIADLKDLSEQSNKFSDDIDKILGDANRVSMAASFKERKEELDESIKKSDALNHWSLILIFALSFILFIVPFISNLFGKPITGDIDLKFFYERFLIILPLGFISWFASRRSQYLFQLREDYAYKYSSAMAFEGYKRQAENNEEMHDELLKIAITNLGRTPTSVFDKDLKHAPTDKVVEAIKDAIPKIK